MTKGEKFKAKVRARKANNGVSYSAARHVLHDETTEPTSSTPERAERRGAYRDSCLAAWRSLANKLAGERGDASWQSCPDIARVLSEVAKLAPQNHVHFPTLGGQDLEGAAQAEAEEGCIELDMGSRTHLIRPAYLKLVRPTNDPLGEWAYFWLQADQLAPSHLWTAPQTSPRSEPDFLRARHTAEEVLEIAPGTYVDRSCWDDGHLGFDEHGDEIPLPPECRLMTRYFRGGFIILTKGGGYNDLSAYDAEHEKLGESSYRGAIQHLVDRLHASGRYGVDRFAE